MVAVVGFLAPILRRNRLQPPEPPGKFPRSLLLIPCALYLYRVHYVVPQYRAEQRRKAQRKGLSVEEFRDEELWQIEVFWNPYMRFFALRNLEKECVSLSRWQNDDRRMKGEPELPAYRPVVVETGLTPYLRLLAKTGPRGPNHLYAMIREWFISEEVNLQEQILIIEGLMMPLNSRFASTRPNQLIDLRIRNRDPSTISSMKKNHPVIWNIWFPKLCSHSILGDFVLSLFLPGWPENRKFPFSFFAP